MPKDSPIRAKRMGLLYFPLPKVANTSLKWFFVLNATGPDIKNKIRERNVHRFFDRPGPFDSRVIRENSDLEPFVVIRDPISRLLSCYGNRIAHWKVQLKTGKSRRAIERADLPAEPTADEFFLNLRKYQRASFPVYLHTAPCSVFLGRSLEPFAHVHRLENMDRLTQFLASRANGYPRRMGRYRTEGPKITLDDLTLKARRALAVYAEDDAVLLRNHYDVTVDGWRPVSAANSSLWRRIFGR